MFDCVIISLVIDGSVLFFWLVLIYQWEDLSGIVLVMNMDQFFIEDLGFYVLLLEDMEMGCVERDIIQVIQDIEMLILEVGFIQWLDCVIMSVLFSVVGLMQGEEIQYVWQNENGFIVVIFDFVMVNILGIYILVVFNICNSCQSEDEVVIIQDIEVLVVDVGQLQ